MLAPPTTTVENLFNQKQPPEVFYKKGALKNFAKFTGNHLCQSLFFNKVAGLRPATLFKKRLCHRCFPVNFAQFLRTLFSQNNSGGCFCLTHYQRKLKVFPRNSDYILQKQPPEVFYEKRCS